MPYAGEDVEQQKHLTVATGNAKQFSNLGSQYGRFLQK